MKQKFRELFNELSVETQEKLRKLVGDGYFVISRMLFYAGELRRKTPFSSSDYQVLAKMSALNINTK